MNNQLTKCKTKFNSKKGLTLVELIVAIMILLIAIGASVGGLTLSYRSTMMGAEKDDAQSLAQRDCDIIMSCITTNIEDGKTVNDLFIDPEGNPKFKNSYPSLYLTNIQSDINIGHFVDSYNTTQYSLITEIQNTSELSGSSLVKNQFFMVDVETREIGVKEYLVYRITTYVYYSDTACVSCEGEVNIEKP